MAFSIPRPPCKQGGDNQERESCGLMLIDDEFQRTTVWHCPPELWRKLKPLTRQLRREQTPAEKRVWQYLRRDQLGARFYRQFAIYKFIVDFYGSQAGLIVEIDGPIHDFTVEEDAIRQEYLENLGFKIIRFTNEEVFRQIGQVITSIRDEVIARMARE